jgi:hypothetical protein
MKKLLVASIPLVCTQSVFLEPPSYQERIRGVYENKIRQNAAPEKVFETFATLKQGKSFFMTPEDLFKAISPFNYSQSTSYKFLETRESFIIKAVDSNKDGRISFSEYFFFIVLLSTPTKFFKEKIRKQEGKINKAQFMDLMLDARKVSPQGKKLINSHGLDPRSVKITDEDFKQSCSHLFEEFFKHTEWITWESFKELKDSISEEILTYEFYKFNVEDQTISAEDFGKSIISYMPTSSIDMYLNRLENLELTGRVSLNQYLAFMFTLQEASLIHQKFQIEHEEHGILTKPEISKVLNEICNSSLYCRKKGLSISDSEIDIFIKLLDLDDSQSLEPEEIFSLIANISSQGTSQAMAPHFEEVTNELKRFLNALCKFCGIAPFLKVKTEERHHH